MKEIYWLAIEDSFKNLIIPMQSPFILEVSKYFLDSSDIMILILISTIFSTLGGMLIYALGYFGSSFGVFYKKNNQSSFVKFVDNYFEWFIPLLFVSGLGAMISFYAGFKRFSPVKILASFLLGKYLYFYFS